MTTNPEARQASCRATSGTAYTVDGDWLAMCDSMGIAAGTANERLLAFYNASLGASWDVAAWDEVEWDGAGGNHTNINEIVTTGRIRARIYRLHSSPTLS
jgi:hypothetical protein